ncbi:MAG TPA: hypothetical protein VM513_24570 [Kofleriaceae bacterium]|jgi:hypothetical protein|nr:hypothetical protein [Kofleriaceae bacterium]
MGERVHARICGQRPFEARASSRGRPTTAGRLAAQAWSRRVGLPPPSLTSWHIEISLDVRDAPTSHLFDDRRDTRFRIEIYADEWGVFFCHQGKASWLRVTDVPFIHKRDEHSLLWRLPALEDIGALLRALEKQHELRFRRDHALIRTNLAGAETAVRLWVYTL